MECIHNFMLYNEKKQYCSSYIDLYKEGFQSIYEVIRVVDGQPLFLEDHVKRIQHSCDLVKINFQINSKIILGYIKELCNLNSCDNGNIKFVINVIDSDFQNTFLYFIPHSYPNENQYKEGIITIKAYEERVNPNAKIVNKSFKKRIKDMLQLNNAYEAILIDNKGYITEGSRSNIFFIKGEEVYTSPVEDVLPGITRKYVIKSCRNLGYNVIEKKLHESELNSIDATFMCGTSPKVLPIKKIEDYVYESANNPIVRDIMKEYDRLVKFYYKVL